MFYRITFTRGFNKDPASVSVTESQKTSGASSTDLWEYWGTCGGFLQQELSEQELNFTPKVQADKPLYVCL